MSPVCFVLSLAQQSPTFHLVVIVKVIVPLEIVGETVLLFGVLEQHGFDGQLGEIDRCLLDGQLTFTLLFGDGLHACKKEREVDNEYWGGIE